jgi:hypothetical protein
MMPYRAVKGTLQLVGLRVLSCSQGYGGKWPFVAPVTESQRRDHVSSWREPLRLD